MLFFLFFVTVRYQPVCINELAIVIVLPWTTLLVRMYLLAINDEHIK